MPTPRHGVPAGTFVVNMQATGPTGVAQRLTPLRQRLPPGKHAVAGSTHRGTQLLLALQTSPVPHAL